MKGQDYLQLLRNRIDITRSAFSDRGSRIVVARPGPESPLEVRLAERLTYLQPGVETYRARDAFITELHLIDGEGSPLHYEVESWPHCLCFHTALGDFRLVFHDVRTLVLGLPPHGVSGLRMVVAPQYWETTATGGAFRAVRNLHYVASTELLSNTILPHHGGYLVELLVEGDDDPSVSITIGDAPEVIVTPSFSASLARAEARWAAWFNRVPPVPDRYQAHYAYAWWVMGNNLIAPQGHVMREAMTPSKKQYVGLWLWDNALHALAYRHVDAELARDQIRGVLTHQLPTGMLPDAIYDEGIVSTLDHPIQAEVSKPPILAWSASKLHNADPNPAFLQEIYPALVRWNAWWFAMNDDDLDGLVQYNHPYTSGLDDSPLWDYGMPVESPDINTYLCMQMDALADMAVVLGMTSEASMWRRRAAAMAQRMMAHLWDESAGVFHAVRNHEPVPVLTPFNLYPLWTGRLPPAINERLIAHLTDPAEFWGPYVLPTVARNDPHYDPGQMWRGPVWLNINYFFVEALRNVGRPDLAAELRDRTLDTVVQQSGISEYYHAETGEPPATAAGDFGWSAAVFINLAIDAGRAETTNSNAGGHNHAR